MPQSMPDLPVADVLDAVVAASRGGAVVVTAPPGSGKTMLVPTAVLDDLPAGSRLVLMQPRRLAARAVARQIARLRGVPLGGEIGYQVRFDACTGPDTRLVVETTGIMLRRLLDDVALDGIGAVVLDEFHERSIEMDMVLGMLARIRGSLRPDLRIVVMSATLAAGAVSGFLAGRLPGGCPVVSTDGRLFPVDVRHAPRGVRRELHEMVAETLPAALRETEGHVLVFLPGVGEIGRCRQAVEPLARRHGLELTTLFGDLPPEEQDRVLADAGRRKIILSTNVAETSLTIPGVTAVIDSGLARQLQVSAATGLPRLELVPISQAAAAQRTGRAGRTGPGVCWRLWDAAAHHVRPSAETPEALRVDLAGPLLWLAAIGEHRDFPWLDPPPPAAVDNARQLLVRLGAMECDATGDRITPLGRELARLPAHPRLSRLLLAGARLGVLREASIAAALLSERDPFRAGGQRSGGRQDSPGGPRDRIDVPTRSDVLDRVTALQAFHASGAREHGWPDEAGPVDRGIEVNGLDLHPGVARNVLRTADQLYRLVDATRGPRATSPETALMRAILEAFPDRVARLRPGGQDRGTMVGGRGVRLDRGSRVRQEPLFVAIDVDDSGGEAGVRQASAVERAWLEEEPLRTVNLRTADEVLWQPSRGRVEARLRTTWIDLVIDETPIPITDESAAAELLAAEARKQLDRVLPAADSPAGRLLARIRWLAEAAGAHGLPTPSLPQFDEAALAGMLPDVCRGLRSLDEVRTADWIPLLLGLVGHESLVEIERLAPQELTLASGRRHKLVYEPGRPPRLSVRIQELFGVRETPRIAGGRVPVLLELLGPNHRPQQLTDDLASFWANTYPQVKKELRRRYPKHSWPDDPLATRASRAGPARSGG